MFLLLIAHLLSKQPTFVVGVDHPSMASNHCQAAAIVYLVCVVISIGVLVHDRLRSPLPVPTFERQTRFFDALERPGRSDRAQLRAQAGPAGVEMLPKGSLL